MPAARRKAPPPALVPPHRPTHLRVRAACLSRPRFSQLRQRGRGLKRSANIPQPPPAAWPRSGSRERSCNLGGVGESGLARARETSRNLKGVSRERSVASPASALDGLPASVRPSACLVADSPLEKAERPVRGRAPLASPELSALCNA